MGTQTKTLVIAFNRFQSSDPFRYYEITNDSEDESCEIDELKAAPAAAIYDEVMETGEGTFNHWNAHATVKLHHHPLLK